MVLFADGYKLSSEIAQNCDLRLPNETREHAAFLLYPEFLKVLLRIWEKFFCSDPVSSDYLEEMSGTVMQ